MERLRIGVIGCGRAALDLHLPTLARHEDAEAVAIADPDAAALAAAGDRFEIRRRHPDYRGLLADPAVEAICICGPNDLHAEMALAGLDAGKHVLVEKPLALSIDDCDRLVERAADSDLAAMVGFNLRWHRNVRRARQAIARGALGQTRLLTTTFGSSSLIGEVPAWRADLSRGGGMLALQAIHDFDLWAFLTGARVERVQCSTSDASTGHGPEIATVAASLSSGPRATGSFCGVTGPNHAVAVYGSAARLELEVYSFDSYALVPNDVTAGDPGYRARRPARYARELAGAARNIRRGGDFQVSYQEEWAHFTSCARAGTRPECGFEEGRAATEVLLAVLESAATGRAVSVDEAPRTIAKLSA